ncbi:CBS domain-containing protein [Gandjariella thermophila]|uniref:CBS domain-containing protein n=1 Tax=Gandjariella thermophila TaxID=1931992 RepID=A0A4D4J512_9PSEU|nr:CBS domain-containing protein [Gandjariella thermophila]GDY29053.1 CBS domain-containing protein [Gandjariella thermophila]
MRATDVMSRPVATVHPGTAVREAIVVLTENGCAALPVVDERDRLVGVVTEADLLAEATRVRADAALSVAEVMSAPTVVLGADADVVSIAEAMLAGDARWVPIVDGDLLLGVVCRGDVLGSLVRDDDVIGARVRRLLCEYAGWRRRWLVEVDDGVVTVSGHFADDTEQRIVVALTETVAGVAGVVVRPDRGGAPGRRAPAERGESRHSP